MNMAGIIGSDAITMFHGEVGLSSIQNVEKEEKKVITSLEDININDIEIVGLEEIKPEPMAQPVEPVPGEDMIRHTLEDEFAAEINTLKSISLAQLKH